MWEVREVFLNARMREVFFPRLGDSGFFREKLRNCERSWERNCERSCDVTNFKERNNDNCHRHVKFFSAYVVDGCCPCVVDKCLSWVGWEVLFHTTTSTSSELSVFVWIECFRLTWMFSCNCHWLAYVVDSLLGVEFRSWNLNFAFKFNVREMREVREVFLMWEVREVFLSARMREVFFPRLWEKFS